MSFLYSRATKARHPELFAKDQLIDRRKCSRVVPMEALAVGFARTGTASVRAALETLGIPTHHMYFLFNHRKDVDMWNEAFDSKFFGGSTVLDRDFWDKLLGDVGGVTDFPTLAFAEELINAYPEAKVILWERDEDAWFRSYEKASIDNYGNISLRTLAWIDHGKFGKGVKMTEHGIYEGLFRAKNADELRQNAREVYRSHFQRIRALMRNQPERFLEYKLSDGWEPLFRILGKEVPDEEFPRVNDADSQEEMVGIIMMQIVERLVMKAILITLPIVIAIISWRCTR